MLWDSIQRKEDILAAKQAELADLESNIDTIKSKAYRTVKTGAVAVGVGMVAQYSYIFTKVYEISWDYMEPLCYFIGAGYAILFYGFFMVTHRDPVTGNVFQKFLERRQNAVANTITKYVLDPSHRTWRDAAGGNGRHPRQACHSSAAHSRPFESTGVPCKTWRPTSDCCTARSGLAPRR